MVRPRFLFLSILAALAIARPAEAAPNDLAIVNVMPDFWAFDRTTRGQDEAKRVTAFRRMVLDRHPAAYTMIGGLDDAGIAAYLREVEPLLPAMRRLDGRIVQQIRLSSGALDRELGAMPARPTVYVLPSMFRFDGQARPTATGSIAMFGVDAIARTAVRSRTPIAATDLRPLVSHELFHVRHMIANKDIREGTRAFFGEKVALPPLSAAIWVEGLATCASRRAVPSALLSDILLDQRLADAGPQVASIARGLRPKLGEANIQLVSDYLLAGSSPVGVPSRSGYLIGMIVADDMLQRMTLRQAMAIDEGRLPALVEAAVTRIGDRKTPVDLSRICLPARSTRR